MKIAESKDKDLTILCPECGKKLITIKSIELGDTDLSFRILCEKCYKTKVDGKPVIVDLRTDTYTSHDYIKDRETYKNLKKKNRKLTNYEKEKIDDLEKVLNPFADKYPDINNSFLYGSLSEFLLRTIKDTHKREINRIAGIIDMAILEEQSWVETNTDKEGYISQTTEMLSSSNINRLKTLKRVIKSYYNILD